MIAANPFIIVFVLAVNGVDLFAKLAVKIVVVVIVAAPAKETIFVLFYSRTNLLKDLFGIA